MNSLISLKYTHNTSMREEDRFYPKGNATPKLDKRIVKQTSKQIKTLPPKHNQPAKK